MIQRNKRSRIYCFRTGHRKYVAFGLQGIERGRVSNTNVARKVDTAWVYGP